MQIKFSNGRPSPSGEWELYHFDAGVESDARPYAVLVLKNNGCEGRVHLEPLTALADYDIFRTIIERANPDMTRHEIRRAAFARWIHDITESVEWDITLTAYLDSWR